MPSSAASLVPAETCTSCADAFGGVGTRWLTRQRKLARDVLNQRAAERDVEHLHAAADREQRQTASQAPAHQRDFCASRPGSASWNAGCRVLAEERRIDVAAAGEQQAVDAVQQRRRRSSSRDRRRADLRRALDDGSPRSPRSSGSARWRSGACASHPRRDVDAHQVERARQLQPEVRHGRGAPHAGRRRAPRSGSGAR